MSKCFVPIMMLVFSTCAFSGVYKCIDGKSIIYTSTKKAGCSELENNVGLYSRDAAQMKMMNAEMPSKQDDKLALSDQLHKERLASSEIRTHMKSDRSLSAQDLEAMRQQLSAHSANIKKISDHLS